MNLSPDLLWSLLIGALGLCASLIAYIWHDRTRLQEKWDRMLDTKASIDSVNALQKFVENQASDMKHMREVTHKQEVLLERIAGQLSAIAKDSARLEMISLEEIRALRNSLVGSGRRKTDSQEHYSG